ncbi:MAG: hypothetical protein WAW36_18875 [Methylovulum miyakonense]|uniref:hypothetical protein n=1 Tax=Methylovulum miyakonense TaxID=645578 RepID=UPI003BB649D3
MAILPIKLFRSSDSGAPTLNGVAGALANVLDAVLTTGYNVKSVTSITQTGNVATMTLQAGHGYVADQVVTNAGAVEPEYNGDFLVKAVTPTTVIFDVTGNPASPATGTITTKVASAGWTKTFTGTNKAAYQAASGSGYHVRVDDGQTQFATLGARAAAVSMYKTLSSVDTGTGAVPPSSVWANNVLPWHKSSTADSTARPWLIVASANAFYLFVWPDTASCILHGFGDFFSNIPSDANNAFMLHGCNNTTTFSTGSSLAAMNVSPYTNAVFDSGNSYATSYQYAGVDYSGYSAGGKCCLVGNRTFGGSGFGEIGGLKFPNPLDNGFYYSPVLFLEKLNASGDTGVRGRMPGIYTPQHANPFPVGAISGTTPAYTMLYGFGPSGGNLVAIPIITSGGYIGNLFLDVKGAWA